MPLEKTQSWYISRPGRPPCLVAVVVALAVITTFVIITLDVLGEVLHSLHLRVWY